MKLVITPKQLKKLAKENPNMTVKEFIEKIYEWEGIL